MKKLLFSLFVLISFSNFLVAQPSVYSGKVNPLRPKGVGPSSVEELVLQLEERTTNFIGGVSANSWLDKVKEGVNLNINRLGYLPLKTKEEVLWLVKNSKIVPPRDLNISKTDILSSGSLGNQLYWIDNPAVPENYLVFFAESGEFLILAKWDCLNPVCDLRKKTSSPTPPPAPTIIRDTVWKETVILEKKYRPTPVCVGGFIRHRSNSRYSVPAPGFAAKNPITGNWDAHPFVDQRGAYWKWR